MPLITSTWYSMVACLREIKHGFVGDIRQSLFWEWRPTSVVPGDNLQPKNNKITCTTAIQCMQWFKGRVSRVAARIFFYLGKGNFGPTAKRFSHILSVQSGLSRHHFKNRTKSEIIFLVLEDGRCNALIEKWRKQFGKHLLFPSELRQEHWSSLLKSAKNSNRFQ